MARPSRFPVDDADRALVAKVRPPGWTSPQPVGRYDLLAIGGGAAGLVSTIGAAGVGGRAALIERNLLGGDCLNVGCVPSKALLRAARAAHEARTAERFGVRVDRVDVDFPAVIARLRRERARIADADAATRVRDAGVDVFLGHGRFTGPDTIDVEGRTLRFANAVLTIGSRPARPPIPGLHDVDVLTSEDVWNLDALPQRLVVIGGGPVGCELAQAFQRLGSAVTLVVRSKRLLPRDDADAGARIARQLTSEGVDVLLSTTTERLQRAGGGAIVVARGPLGERRIEADAVLLAVGRTIDTDRLGLDAAGVAVDEHGAPVVDDRLRTSNPRIFAAGDAAGRARFTHAADAMARLVIRNSLFFGRGRVDRLVIPWTTYTDPEVAHVGISAEHAAAAGVGTITVPLSQNDRAIVDGADDGFARLHHDRRGRILGATIVGPHAGELIGTVSLAITAGLDLGAFASTVFPYPTHTEVLKRAGDAWNRTRLTPMTSRLLAAVIALRRR